MREPKIEFDYLQMYFRQPYIIETPNEQDRITVYQPTIGDILRIGERKFFSTLSFFITNTTANRLWLWEELKRDWNTMSDFELFVYTYKAIDPQVSSLMLGDVNIVDFEPLPAEDGLILYNPKTNTHITKEVYNHISQYLRNVFNIFPEEKFTTDPILKKWFINKDKRQKAIDQEKAEKGKEKTSSIQSVISACINHPGFKYKLQELQDVGVCEFYDSVQRLQVYENSTALMKGIYSGFVDTKKINRNEMNFMKNFRDGD